MEIFNEEMQGGVVVDGLSLEKSVYGITTQGGVVSNATTTQKTAYTITTQGGIVSNAIVTEETTYTITTQGGVLLTGVSFSQVVIVAQGGMVGNGTSDETFYDYIDTSGGVVSSANVGIQAIYHIPTSGGIVVDSKVPAQTNYNILSRQELLISGISVVKSIVFQSKMDRLIQRMKEKKRCNVPGITQKSLIGMLPEQSKQREFFKSLDEEQWAIVGFNKRTKEVCIIILSGVGARHVSITLPIYISN